MTMMSYELRSVSNRLSFPKSQIDSLGYPMCSFQRLAKKWQKKTLRAAGKPSLQQGERLNNQLWPMGNKAAKRQRVLLTYSSTAFAQGRSINLLFLRLFQTEHAPHIIEIVSEFTAPCPPSRIHLHQSSALFHALVHSLHPQCLSARQSARYQSSCDLARSRKRQSLIVSCRACSRALLCL